MNPALSNFLDGSRWIAALAVLLTHINNRAFLKIGALEAGERPALLYLWSFVCGFAHHAVVTFFVLSGFLVGGKLLRDLRHIDGPYLRRYATARVVRIYLVLIPVIGLTALLDHQGGQLPGAASMYWPGVMESLTSPVALVGTVLNLQTIFTPLYGSNGPMWSLACEFWYYVCAPLLLAPWTRISPRLAWPMGALGVVLVVAFSVALPDFGAGLVLWFIGAAAAVATWKAPTRAGLLVLVFLGVLLVFRLVMRAQHMDQFLLRTLSDLVVAGALGLVLLAYRQQPASSQRRRALHESLASFSYSLYAIHVPVVMLVCVSLEAGLGFGWQERPTSLAAVALGCACFVAAVAAGYGLSRVTEAHTDRVRRFVLDRALRSRLSIPTP